MRIQFHNIPEYVFQLRQSNVLDVALPCADTYSVLGLKPEVLDEVVDYYGGLKVPAKHAQILNRGGVTLMGMPSWMLMWLR